MTVNIDFNERVIKRIKELRLPVDNMGSILFVLFCLYEEKYALLDAVDDNNKERRMIVLYMFLNRMGFIQEAGEEENILYVLTPEGRELVEYVRENASNVNSEVMEHVIEKEEGIERISDWIKEYISLFPAGRSNDRVYRTSSVDCTERMTWFMNKYGYEKDLILAATKQYVESFKGNFELMRNSSYFIKKNDKEKGLLCDILTACEQYQQQKDEPKTFNLDVI